MKANRAFRNDIPNKDEGPSRWRIDTRQPIENRALVFVKKMIMEMVVVVMLKHDGNVVMVTVRR